MDDPQRLKMEIRRARGKFIAILTSYALGVFNDSLFRQSAMLVAVAMKMPDRAGWVISIFTLPYLVLASQCGWLADRFSKRRVIIAAKVMEVVVISLGGAGLVLGNWWVILPMVFLVGLQAAVFSPALNGAIPELYPASYVTTAKALVTVVVTAMILVGAGLSGVLVRNKQPVAGGYEMGRILVACGVVVVAIFGLLASLGVPRRPAADPKKKFPWSGPIDTVRDLLEIRRDRLLGAAVLAGSYIWFVGALFFPVVNSFAGAQYYKDEGIASAMVACEMIGVAVGGVIASRITSRRPWYRHVPPAVFAMGGLLLALAGTWFLPRPAQLAAIFVLLGGTGLAGGLVMIPCEAFYQIRPTPQRKGTVIAAANCATFVGVFASGPVAAAMLGAGLSPFDCLAIIGLFSVAAGFFLARTFRRAEQAENLAARLAAQPAET